MSDETPAAPAPPPAYQSPSMVSPADLLAGFIEDGVIAAPAPVATPAASTTPSPQKEAAPAPQEVPALLRLAKERDAFRKEMESAKPHLEAFKAFTPQEAARLAKARADGDPVAILDALGFSHTQYTNKLLNKAPATEEPVVSSGNPDVDALRHEVQTLKQEREAERAQAGRREVLTKVENHIKDNPKFATIAGLGDWEGVEKVIIDHWNRYKSLPGDTFEESVELAAELHEQELRKQAERFRPYLTGSATPAQVPAKAPVTPTAGTVTPRTLNNASTTAPAAARTTPKTREEKLAAIIAGEDILE